MIESLLYLTNSIYDIVFVVGLCASFQSCSMESYLIIVKQIFRYLDGATNLGLWYCSSVRLKVCPCLREIYSYKILLLNINGLYVFVLHCTYF